MGRHTDDNSNGIADHAEVNPYGIANQADPDWRPPESARDGVSDVGDFDREAAYLFPDPGWRPESDFTGEWIDELIASDAATGTTP